MVSPNVVGEIVQREGRWTTADATPARKLVRSTRWHALFRQSRLSAHNSGNPANSLQMNHVVKEKPLLRKRLRIPSCYCRFDLKLPVRLLQHNVAG